MVPNHVKAGKLLRLFGWIFFVGGSLLAVGHGIGIYLGDTYALVKLGSSLVIVGISILYLDVGKAVEEHESWSKGIGKALGVLSLFAFPVGTILGIYILRYLKDWDEYRPQVSASEDVRIYRARQQWSTWVWSSIVGAAGLSLIMYNAIRPDPGTVMQARLVQLENDFNILTTVIYAFKDKYNCLPGDCDQATLNRSCRVYRPQKLQRKAMSVGMARLEELGIRPRRLTNHS